MDLSCPESVSTPVNYARNDPTIFKDERVLRNLLIQEQRYAINMNYFEEIQSDIKPFMRKVVATWMLEVCEEQLCEEQVLPLAVTLMDRFLCMCDIRRQQLQLLGATCLLIASKVRSTNLLPVELLCAYTDYSVTHEHIMKWEMLVLSKLKWNISPITGFDYVDQIIERCSWGQESHLLRRHAHTLVSICYTEPDLIQTLPSVIAASCICSAVRGLKIPSTQIASVDISTMLNVIPMQLEMMVSVIDKAVEKANQKASAERPTEKSSETFDSSSIYIQPETPTEVESVYF